jgi:RNA polymerase sigma-70 factor (ECF subfamily)
LSLLEAQNRALWDKQLIERGLRLLSESAAGDTLSTYHVEAAIAAEHVLAPSIERTNWRRIVELYDLLYAIAPTPVVALNRAIAVAELEGPERGLEEVRSIGDNERLFENYPFYDATLGELERRAERPLAACQHFERAIALSRANSERRVFEAKLAECRRALS